MPKRADRSNPPKALHARLRYDPEAGNFHWKVRTHGYGGVRMPGDLAGTPGGEGYVNIGLDGVNYRAHRLAWYMMTGEWLQPREDVDHENGVRNDNRWRNLRRATRTQNSQNRHNAQSNNKSGHNGVSWRKDTQKWHARITVSRKIILLGDYLDIADAIAARKAAEAEHFGAFAPQHQQDGVRGS